jgi:ankyrin repeat protein
MSVHNDLVMAARVGNLREVKVLISQGADIHFMGDEAICIAAQKGHQDVVKHLVISGANFHVINDWPLRYSVKNSHIGVAKYLISQGADVHAKNDFPLRMAVQNNDFIMVKLLVESGADIHVNNDEVIKTSKNRGYHNLYHFLKDYLPNTETKIETGTTQHEYCSCNSTNVVQSYALGKPFMYCRGCGNERR